MISLIQRVTSASVTVDGEQISCIGTGLLAMVAVQPLDTRAQVDRTAERLLTYRVFADEAGKMNRNLQQVNGELLLVPQFTLAANTDTGNRPSFASAAAPDHGAKLFAELVAEALERWPHVKTGRFGADMAVGLVNDGPVTFWLEVPPNGA